MLKAHLPKSWKDGPTLCLGCGDGYEMDVMASLGFKNLHGITNDEREAQGQANIVVGDIHDMERFGAGEFRFLYSKETLEHLISPWCALLEMNRITAIGGEFFHLISCGSEKQRESYHVSCFPTWLWYDLFKKAGFKVTKMLTGHPTEAGFLGFKERDVDLLGMIEGRYSYPLLPEMKGVPTEALYL